MQMTSFTAHLKKMLVMGFLALNGCEDAQVEVVERDLLPSEFPVDFTPPNDHLTGQKLDGKYEFKIFNEAFRDENDAVEQLKDYEALLIMRERTKITKSLINRLKKLKFIITSGMRNKAIDLDAAKQKKIIVCGTEINKNPTAELTWALILGLVRNFKEEIDNMYQGYWQTTVGFELKGKILGLIGLGKIGSQVAKVGKAFGMQE